MRVVVPCVALALLAACQPPVPNDRGGGVGFESYGAYQKRRALEAKMAVLPANGPVNQLPVAPAPSSAAALMQQSQSTIATAPPDSVAQPDAGQPAGMAPAAAAPTAEMMPADNTGISDEQDFSAVASRETIASDKERIEQNKAQFQQIAPTELPQRKGSSAGPDLIEYAINAPNRLGQPYYKRGRSLFGNSERACARFNTPEEAQMAFLKAGGPQRDRKNLDPDGDGFACYWDPTPFQKVRG